MSFFVSVSFAQEINNTKEVKLKDKFGTSKDINAPQAFGDKITIKNGTKTLIEIVEEGTGGSIFIPDGGFFSSSTNKLFNFGGNLFWNGNQLGLASSSDNDWTISENNIYNSNTGNVGIGTTNPISKLSINSSGDLNNSVHAESNLDNGRGVFGSATNNDVNSQNYGGYFRSSGGNGRGVFGFTNGINSYAVYGNTSGSNAIGVLGNTSGLTGIGVKGTAENTGNSMNYGGYFEASGQLGRGVYGYASSSTGQNFGGFFKANGEEGAAVYADGTSTTWAGFFLGDVNITESLTVNGVNVTSDSRFKKNISQIENTLSFLEKINVYTYNWNSEKYPERNFKNDKLQYGVLAQELEEVYPDLVKTDKDGYKSVDYIKLSVLTLQAVKELEKQNHDLKRQNAEYSLQNVEMELRLSKIEKLLDGQKLVQVSK
jgi:hypothetical protein